jgi:hypothetical protein
MARFPWSAKWSRWRISGTLSGIRCLGSRGEAGAGGVSADFVSCSGIVSYSSCLFAFSAGGGCPQGVVPLFGAGRENGEMSMGEHREGNMPVPGAVQADLIVIEGDF